MFCPIKTRLFHCLLYFFVIKYYFSSLTFTRNFLNALFMTNEDAPGQPNPHNQPLPTHRPA